MAACFVACAAGQIILISKTEKHSRRLSGRAEPPIGVAIVPVVVVVAVDVTVPDTSIRRIRPIARTAQHAIVAAVPIPVGVCYLPILAEQMKLLMKTSGIYHIALLVVNTCRTLLFKRTDNPPNRIHAFINTSKVMDSFVLVVFAATSAVAKETKLI